MVRNPTDRSLFVAALANLLLSCGGGEETPATVNKGAGFNQARAFNAAVQVVAWWGNRAYCGGGFTTYNSTSAARFISLNEDLTLDVGTTGTGFDAAVNAIVAPTDGTGDLFIGGDFGNYAGSTSNGIARLNGNLTLDTPAAGTGFSASPTVFAIAPATDGSGDIWVGGTFLSYNGTTSNNFIRLNGNLTLDTAAVGAGFQSTVQTLATAADDSGDLFVGGIFLSYRTTTVDRIARLNPDGSAD